MIPNIFPISTIFSLYFPASNSNTICSTPRGSQMVLVKLLALLFSQLFGIVYAAQQFQNLRQFGTLGRCETIWHLWIVINSYKMLSTDPGLGQGRGGAWDHRRCGTSPSSLSTVKPILQPSSHINSFFCRLPALKPSLLQPTATPRPHINGFLWPLLQPTGTPEPHIHTSMASYGHPSLPFASSLAANRHPRATHQWLLMATLAANRHPRATHPHINGFLWASKSAVCQLSCSQQAPPRHTSIAPYGHSCIQPPPQGHTSMASYGHPSLPFASPKTFQTLKTLQTPKTLQTLKTLQSLKNRQT